MKTERVKFCWLAQQSKKGWKLAFVAHNVTFWLSNLYFDTEEDVKRAIKGNIVFVHLKEQ